MAIAWLTVLKSVPWSEVIGNAPKLVDGAKSLWNAVARTHDGSAAGEVGEPGATASDTPLAALEGQVRVLEAEVTDLHRQMVASSELIKALADQNAQLVLRIEANRRRTLWLGVATAVLALVAALGFYLAVLQRLA